MLFFVDLLYHDRVDDERENELMFEGQNDGERVDAIFKENGILWRKYFY